MGVSPSRRSGLGRRVRIRRNYGGKRRRSRQGSKEDGIRLWRRVGRGCGVPCVVPILCICRFPSLPFLRLSFPCDDGARRVPAIAGVRHRSARRGRGESISKACGDWRRGARLKARAGEAARAEEGSCGSFVSELRSSDPLKGKKRTRHAVPLRKKRAYRCKTWRDERGCLRKRSRTAPLKTARVRHPARQDGAASSAPTSADCNDPP